MVNLAHVEELLNLPGFLALLVWCFKTRVWILVAVGSIGLITCFGFIFLWSVIIINFPHVLWFYDFKVVFCELPRRVSANGWYRNKTNMFREGM